MLTFFHCPGTCSLGIHVLLEEAGARYQLSLVNLMKGEQNAPAYLAQNPKAKVPALLREDGSLLTEWPAIATWLALTYDKALLPTDAEGLARTLEAVDYLVATVHMQGFTRIWRPDHFAASESEHPAIKDKGRAIYEKGLAAFEAKMQSLEQSGRDYLGGERPSIADAALFYVEYWKVNRLKEPLPDALAGHYARMMQRPAVVRALTMEGLL
jgi:glutathione S-transferase